MNRTTQYSYDVLNRLVKLTTPDPAKAGGVLVTEFSYDALDNLVTVKDPLGHTTRYNYNGLGDLLQLVSPDTGTTRYSYDNAGQLKTKTDARNKTETRSYDNLGRVTSLAFGDQTHTFTWDSAANGKGRLASLQDTSGTTHYRYDAQGRLSGKTLSFTAIGGVGGEAGKREVSYSWNEQGQLTQLTYPSGFKVTYSYNSNGQVSAVQLNGQALISNIQYQPFGGIKSWSWAGGNTHHRSYNLDGQLELLQHGSLYSKSYRWNAANQLKAQTDNQSSSLNQSYDYDLLDRLNKTTRGTVTEQYQYDANGNRTQSQVNTAATSYSIDPASNRLLKQTGSNAKTYTLDASGNQTSDGSITLTYDNAGRPRTATQNGQSVSNFFYNAQGQLAIKTANSKPIQFVYDEAGHLLAEHADPATQSPSQDHIWLGDTPIAVVRPNSSDPSKPLLYHVYADHLNTPRAIYDAFNKRLTWRWESEAFGNTLPDQDADKNGSQFVYNLRFPGQYWDNGIKLSHNWYRTYNPDTGRYIQSDPIGLNGGLNTYLYAYGNSPRFVDRDGLDSVSVEAGLHLPLIGDIATALGWNQIPVSGGDVGVAVSFPGPLTPDAAWDLSLYASGDFGGGIGANKATVTAGYSRGGSCDIDDSIDVNAIHGPVAVGVTLDRHANLNNFSLSDITGAKAGAALAPGKAAMAVYKVVDSILKTRSLRDVWKTYNNNAIGFGYKKTGAVRLNCECKK
ncbi:RHS repeat protein [Chitinivorax sp. B]|uniref:RHS repeat domain-containing protein n=1 Tax=Chitinivorax sp. B TaxID=2502235 RepID=UPI0014859CB7|nr:RHS repeat protein [Chitinivorax sp. B]